MLNRTKFAGLLIHLHRCNSIHNVKRTLPSTASVIINQPQLLQPQRCGFHDEFTSDKPPLLPTKSKTIPTAVASKYQVFRDIDATVILDLDEERQRERGSDADSGTINIDGDESVDPSIYAGLNMERM